MPKIDVAILGATGAVGQRFIQLLENHPWFQVSELVGKSSAGKTYGEAVNWVLDGGPPDTVKSMIIKGLNDSLNSQLVFSALPKEAAVQRELELAKQGHIVCTNASAHRMASDVPLVLPEVNSDHLQLINVQRRNRNWAEGALIANSNCTVMAAVLPLAPLRVFGITKVIMVSEQAVSGAGYPGVASLDILDNVIPYVGGDEDKMETESLKMLGQFSEKNIEFLRAVTSATCTRVPVSDGHLVNISVELRDRPSIEDILEAWMKFETDPAIAQLPSAPARAIEYLAKIDRPQPRRDRNAGNGMTVSIGRLRECPVLGYKFVSLVHNTIRGAAGCSILNAELLVAKGYLGKLNAELTTTTA